MADAVNVPPYSTEAEDAVIGALLLDNAVAADVQAQVTARDFFQALHRTAFDAAARLIVAGSVADVITVAEAAGLDVRALDQMASSVPSARHALHYAQVVRRLSRRRQAIVLARELAADLMLPEKPDSPALPDLLGQCAGALLDLVGGEIQAKEPRHITELVPEWLGQLEQRAEGVTDAISTGLLDMDRVLDGGPRPGDLIVLAARPSMGKSALALTMARHMAATREVLICSMEDSEQMLVSRQVAGAGRINLADLRRPPREGARADTMWSRVSEAVDQLLTLNLSIDDQPALSLQAIRVKAQQVRRRRGRLHAVFVDYVQLMEDEGETRAQELTRIARGLKALAKELAVPIIVLSQLSRKADETKGPPSVHHLAESGGIEQAADAIGLLFRWNRVDKKRDPSEAQVEWVKVKNGPTDTVQLHFDGAHQRFSDSTREPAYV